MPASMLIANRRGEVDVVVMRDERPSPATTGDSTRAQHNIFYK